VPSVILLLSKDFTKLVIVSFLLAVPLAWYIMHQWLSGFAFRIEIGPGIFVLAGLSALLIAWLTVSGQSAKAATANPVKSLRSE
jgi:putative ABC transport system permease protein